MNLPVFYKEEITSESIVAVVTSIVKYHQKTLEDKLEQQFEPILVLDALNTPTHFSNSFRKKKFVMGANVLFNEVFVNVDYFGNNFLKGPPEADFYKRAFIELVTLHEMSHLSFLRDDSFFSLYFDLLLMDENSLENKHFVDLSEGFAQALSLSYLENYYSTKIPSLKAYDLLLIFLPYQINKLASTSYFPELLATCRTKSIDAFFNKTKQLGNEILNSYEQKKQHAQENLKKQVAKKEMYPYQLSLPFR